MREVGTESVVVEVKVNKVKAEKADAVSLQFATWGNSLSLPDG